MIEVGKRGLLRGDLENAAATRDRPLAVEPWPMDQSGTIVGDAREKFATLHGG
jgi:hypothetical protein